MQAGEAGRGPSSEQEEIGRIVRGFRALQDRAGAGPNRRRARGTHAKGVCARAVFEVLDVAAGRDPELAARLAVGLYARPAAHAATIRFANSSPHANSDWVPDVRGASFAVDLAGAGGATVRHDYSLQSAPILPFNDVHEFAVYAQVVGADSEVIAAGSLSFRDQMVFARTKGRVLREQTRQEVLPYQRLRYWSNVPFRHGSDDIIKYTLVPHVTNAACPLTPGNPDALRDELARHVNEDAAMSVFDFGIQFLDARVMRHQGQRREAAFWIENAAIEWPEQQSPFHTIARLTLHPRSLLSAAESDAMYIDVTEHSTEATAPVGAVNRARWHAEAASRSARQQSRE